MNTVSGSIRTYPTWKKRYQGKWSPNIVFNSIQAIIPHVLYKNSTDSPVVLETAIAAKSEDNIIQKGEFFSLPFL
ncbi:hypothetical protein EVAR_58998_1 [Eumeta japonica]|uniref:Uncharacterized protein n=1 Tax=Eumeta variegata TaxID=151549 RepID=A0A4C1ZIS9_EUMVA|nr:hypothetical protein EVAR_58998_1 [Eumeta japonica]